MRPSIPHRQIAVFTLALGVAACGREAPRTPANRTIRDSAGIRVVEYRALDTNAVERWTIATTADLKIGSVDGAEPYLLHAAERPVRFGDGRVAVALQPPEIRMYDSTGRYLRTVARHGSGPGEIRSVDYLAVMRGDSLAVYDGGQRRFSVFDAAGRFVRSTSMKRWADEPEVEDFPTWRIAGVFPDGSVLMARTQGELPPGPDGTRTDSISIIRVSPAGAVLARMGRHMWSYTVWVGPGGRGDRGPNSMANRVATAGLGVAGDRTFYVDPYTADVSQYDTSGRLVTVTRFGIERVSRSELPDPPPRPGSASSGQPSAGIDLRASLPATLPALLPTSFGDRDGNVWVAIRGRGTGRAPPMWYVVDSSGVVRAIAQRDTARSSGPRLVFHLSGNPGIDNLSADGRYVVVVSGDSLGVEHVSLFPIRRSPAISR